MIRIRSKKPGFRRGGMAHSTEWTEYPDGRFTGKELARLQAEPMLQVEIVAETVAPPEPAAAPPEPEPETPEEAPATERKTTKAARK